MTDERDIEIARLRGQLDAVTQHQGGRRDKPGFDPGRLLAWLAMIVIGGFIAAVAIGSALPDPPTLAERQAACRQRHGEEASYALNKCLADNLADEIRSR